ncbi:hypothetical protein A5631_00455 [Mycolicibacter heraklionensis]|nr:hypothetical protein A5631_00455 [Mycolicibacter heraklionensis]
MVNRGLLFNGPAHYILGVSQTEDFNRWVEVVDNRSLGVLAFLRGLEMGQVSARNDGYGMAFAGNCSLG